jgi:hypothetical protein
LKLREGLVDHGRLHHLLVSVLVLELRVWVVL